MIAMNRVCAVVITFHPQPDTLMNLATLRPQVEGLVVVDNGSGAEAIASLRAASQALIFTLIENGQNLGIATGLNIGVQWAKSHGYDFVGLFDQDSTVTDGFMEKMVSMYQAHSRRDSIALIGAGYKHRVTGECPAPRFLARDGGPIEVMTSGTFMPTRIFDACGYFEDDLFIDLVDYEYCFRVRRAGYIALCCHEALLLHAAGSPARVKLLGKTILTFSNHGAGRWYYITRNSFLLLGIYGKQFPQWAIATVFQLFIKAPMKILLVKGNRLKKICNMILGAMDGLRGRTGYRVKL